MTTRSAPVESDAVPEKTSESRKLIRGSSLLTLGRGIAIVLNFVVQIIIVRCLMKADYGAFAYGLSVVSMGASVAVFGLGRMLNRFGPMFQEQKQFGRMAGTIFLSLCCVTCIGIGIVVVVIGLQGFLGNSLVRDPLSLSLMLILIVLTPLRALDSIFEELFAAFAKPKDLFVRRHLIGPLLKLAAVVPLLFIHSNVRVLAVSFVVCGAMGTLYSMVILWRVFRKAELLRYFRRDQMEVPARQVFGFSLPLLSTDLLLIVRTSLVTLVLEFCHGTLAVAAFRAVLPVARLNTAVADSFRLLFTPAISRMYARGENRSIDMVFWKSSAWIAVATFPLLVACLCLSETLTVTLFGEKYADSATALSLLATGFYLSAVIGLNGEILKAHGRVSSIFRVDMLTVVAAIALNVWLIPQWNVMGGCITTVLVLLLRPIGNQITIMRLKLMKTIDRSCLRLFTLMIGVAAAAWLIPELMEFGTAARASVAAVASLIVLLAALPVLDIRHTFPELLKFRLFRSAAKAEGV